MSMPVRAGTAAELAAVRHLLAAARLPVEDLDSSGSRRFWVVEDDHRVIAAIGLECFGTAGLLRSLVVAPSHRRHGLGSSLVATLEREAHIDGVGVLVLLTETAEAFFAARGYAAIGRERVADAIRHSAEFRSLCPAAAVCMAKSLPAARMGVSNG